VDPHGVDPVGGQLRGIAHDRPQVLRGVDVEGDVVRRLADALAEAVQRRDDAVAHPAGLPVDRHAELGGHRADPGVGGKAARHQPEGQLAEREEALAGSLRDDPGRGSMRS
jgi:hypothetical protein